MSDMVLIARRHVAPVVALADDDPGASRVYLTAARVCAALAGLLAALGLAGWIFEVDVLTRLLPGEPPMKINTACALVVLALCAFVTRPLALLCAALVELLALATLVEYAAGIRLGIDQLISADPHPGSYPGRMSVVTATSIALIAAGMFLVRGKHPQRAQLVVLAALMLDALIVLGYAFNVPSLYMVRPVSAVAIHTVAALLLLSVAVLLAVPGGLLPWAVGSTDAGALLVRRLLPVALVGLPVVGFLALLCQRAGWFDVSTGAALRVILSALVITLFTWTAARRVTEADRASRKAIDELTALRVDLERQVDERADQLQHRRNEIAVLEDRQRIAADLHDIVIQRLFAAGMFLQSGVSSDPSTRERVDAAVEAMDTAIKDLRASIFELGGQSEVRADFGDALQTVCSDSERILGFTPDLVVDDPDHDAERARDDVLAVAREALANVARHARATQVSVVLRTADGVIGLTITDNGCGMGDVVRRSGTRNMLDRARVMGGGCNWSPVVPHGTQVHWYVPAVTAATA
jgi:signal transduction histidine kinase